MRLEPLSYYRFYWRDYRANRKVRDMNYIERGLYRELLDECWAEGFIPDDLDKLATICDCPKQVVADAWPVLSTCFKEIAPGVLINPRMNRERTAKDEERVQKALAGARGGFAKAKSANEITEAEEPNHAASASNPEASAKQMPYSRAKQKQEQSRAETEQAASAAPPHLRAVLTPPKQRGTSSPN